MNKVRIIFLTIFLLFFFSIFPINTFASDNSFITIVNPVRISTYVKNPEKSLEAEYREIESRSLPATWLVTYDVLKKPEMLKVLKSFNSNQELGIFLEVTSGFTNDSAVKYNLRDSWHRATSLFLSGYKQNDRKKLIDKVFESFKREFGYYPKSVGSWWTDAYSLNYLSDEYHVTNNLSVSDQYELDGYTVWGTPWSVPYYPSKINAAQPANSFSSKIPIVMLRWAPRDPLNGYKSPNNNNAGMFSSQDYSTIGLPDSYFQKIVNLYTENQPYNKLSVLTAGLEGDLSEETFETTYSRRLDMLLELNNSRIVTAAEFADWYRLEFKKISPSSIIISDDFLGTAQKSIWYQNANYRAGFVYDGHNKLTLRDLRIYYSNFEEPFFNSPNKQNDLYVLLPYIIDSVLDPESSKSYSCGSYIGAEESVVSFDKCKIIFNDDSIEISGQNVLFSNLKGELNVHPDGKKFNVTGFRIPYGLLRRFPVWTIDFLPISVFIVLLGAGFLIFRFGGYRSARFVLILTSIVVILFFASERTLMITQSESNALSYLSRLPGNIVLTYYKDCLRCSWQSRYEPAPMAGYKKYIKQAGKKVVESLKAPLAKSPADIKSELEKNRADYLYLTKYEDNIEQLPFPSAALGIKKVFENANVQIFKVIK